MHRKFIERTHPTNSIQIESLDDQVSSFTLFRVIEDPIDISTFNIRVEFGWGLSPYYDRFKANLEVSVEKSLALIHHGKTDPMSLPEIIE